MKSKTHRKGIHTFLERKIRYYQARPLENINSELGVQNQLQAFSSLPPKTHLSTTFDNGRENYNHTNLKIKLKMKTSSVTLIPLGRKKSTNTSTVFLRRYIPKKTDLTTVTQTELDSIVEEINNRPLECPRYQTPNKAFTHELQSITN